ncbi:15862_t:CDS:2, partial [Acaulospora colombiana]
FYDEYSHSSLDFSIGGPSEIGQGFVDERSAEGLPSWLLSVMAASQPELGYVPTVSMTQTASHDWDSVELSHLPVAGPSGLSYQPQFSQTHIDLLIQEESGNAGAWKWSHTGMEVINNTFRRQLWFNNREVEPRLSQEDLFVQSRLVKLKSQSRFSCLFGYHQNRYYCRIPHQTEKGETCNESWKKPKDALAH